MIHQDQSHRDKNGGKQRSLDPTPAQNFNRSRISQGILEQLQILEFLVVFSCGVLGFSMIYIFFKLSLHQFHQNLGFIGFLFVAKLDVVSSN